MNDSDSALKLGPRIKAVRESNGWTQAQLAKALGFKDRQTLSDIEIGKRSVKPTELVLISDLFDQDIGYFLDPFNIAGEAKFNWRASPQLPEKTLDDFESKAGRWIGLLRWLRSHNLKTNPLKLCLRLHPNSSFEQAQQRAQELIDIFDLGDVPARSLAQAIETKLDIPVMFVDTNTHRKMTCISGATCHLHDMSVILINRHEPAGRRHFDMAHELFHALTWDAMQPEHRESNCIEQRKGGKRIEQLADNFAAALLMPHATLKDLMTARTAPTIERLVSIANRLEVTPSALAWRLFNLKWIDEPTLQALKSQPGAQTGKVLPQRFSTHFVSLLHNAIDNGRLSARKARKALGMTPDDLESLFTEYSLPVPFEV